MKLIITHIANDPLSGCPVKKYCKRTTQNHSRRA